MSCDFDLSFIKFLINTREKQELPGKEPGTSGLQAFGCPTEPAIYPRLNIYIYIFIYLFINFYNIDTIDIIIDYN